MSDSFFSQKSPNAIPTGQEQEAVDADPSEFSGGNVRIGTPIWRSFVQNKQFQEQNREGIQAEQNQIRQAGRASRQPVAEKWGGDNGKLFRRSAAGLEQFNAEDYGDDPEVGGYARKSVWDRDKRAAAAEHQAASLMLQDPTFKAREMTDAQIADKQAEALAFPTADPQHAAIQRQIDDNAAFRSEKTALEQRAYDAKVRAFQIEQTDPDTHWQNRSAPTAADQRAVMVADGQKQRAEANAADQSAAAEEKQLRAELAQGVKGPDLAAKQARLAEISASRAVIGEAKVQAEAPIKQVQAEAKNPPKDFFEATDLISGLWDSVRGLGATAPAAFYQLTEGLVRPDQYSPSAKAAFAEADAWNKEMQAKTEANQKAGTSSSVGESVREAGQSLAFSLGSMAAAVPAGLAGGAAGTAMGAAAGLPAAGVGAVPGAITGGTIGTIAGVASSMAAGGAAAYRMAGASFLNESFQNLQAASQEKSGRPMNEAEMKSAYDALLPIAKNTALWEAGPEAVGNAVTLGAGKIIFGLGKGLASKFAKTVGGKVTAGAGALATELAGETVTNVEQSADQLRAQAIAQGQDPNAIKANWTTGGVVDSFKQIAPQTLALMGMMSVAGGGVKLVSKATGIGAPKPDGTPTTPLDIQPAVNTSLAAIDPEAAPATPEEIAGASLLGGKDHGPDEYAKAVLIERDLLRVKAEDDQAEQAADAAITAAVDPKERKIAEANRELLKTGRTNLVRAVVKIAAGQNPHDLTKEELAALGMIREEGEIFAMDEQEREAAGLTVQMADVGPDGSVILMDAAIERVKAASPLAGERIAMPEATAMQKAQARADAAAQQVSTDTPDGAQGDPATGFPASAGAFPVETKGAVEFDVPMRDGTVLRVQASDPAAALVEAANIAPITGQAATPVPNVTNPQGPAAVQGQAPPQVPVPEVPVGTPPPADPGAVGGGAAGNGEAQAQGEAPVVADQDRRANDAGVLPPPPGLTEPQRIAWVDAQIADRDAKTAAAAASTPAPGQAALATAKAHIAEARKSPKVAAALNVTSDPAAKAQAKPDGTIDLNPERVIAEAIAGGMDDAQAGEYFSRVLDEEIRHAAQYAAAAMLWKISGSTDPLPVWRENHYAGIWQAEFSAEKQDAARDLYTRKDANNLAKWKLMSDGDKALEAIRMMSQDQVTEEAVFLWTNIGPRLRTALKAALASLKSFAAAASPALQQEITNLENALKQLTATESQPRRGSPKAGPKQPAASGQGAGNPAATPQAGTGQAPGGGRPESAPGDSVSPPLALGTRVEFVRDGERLTGEIALLGEKAVRVQLAEGRQINGMDKVMVFREGAGLKVLEVLEVLEETKPETKPTEAPASPPAAEVVAETKPEPTPEESSAVDEPTPKPRATAPAAEESPALDPLAAIDAELAEAMKGLFASSIPAATPESYLKPISAKRFAVLLPVVTKYIEAGVDTPAKLAERLSGTLDGKLMPFSQSLWGLFKSSGVKGEWEPDWAGVYAKMDTKPALIEKIQPAASEQDADAPITQTLLADFVGKYLESPQSTKARVDMPQQIIRLSISQKDTEAVMNMVFAAGKKSPNGKTLISNTEHYKLWSELRDALGYIQRKGTDAGGGPSTSINGPAAIAANIAKRAAPLVEIVTPAPAVTKAAKKTVRLSTTDVKRLKAQKEYLLAALDKAIEEAPDTKVFGFDLTPEGKQDLENASKSKYGIEPAALTDLFAKYDVEIKGDIFADSNKGKLYTAIREKTYTRPEKLIEIAVPGDGTFRVVNDKQTLKDFRKNANTRFPTNSGAASTPSATTPRETAIAKVGTPKDNRDFVAIAGMFVSNDPAREVLQNVHSDGENLVGTNGKQVMVLKRKVAGTEEKPVHFNGKTQKLIKLEGTFPQWKQVMPREFTAEVEIDTAAVQKIVLQAKAIAGKEDGQKSLMVWKDADGKMGYTLESTEFIESNGVKFQGGLFAGGEANPETAELMTKLDVFYFLDGLKAMRLLGHEKVKLKFSGLASVLEADGAQYVQAAMRLAEVPFHPLSGMEAERQAALPVEEPKIDASSEEAVGMAGVVGDTKPESTADAAVRQYREKLEFFQGGGLADINAATDAARLGKFIGHDANQVFNDLFSNGVKEGVAAYGVENLFPQWVRVKGPFAERSKSLDDTKSKPYYQTTVEKAARAFERYTVDRLEGEEISNDYLVNIVKNFDEALPTAEEMDAGIRQAFDGLFNILDSVETTQGTALQAASIPPAQDSDIDSPRSLQLSLEPWDEQRESQRPTSGNDQRIAASAIRSFRNALGPASNLRFFTLAGRDSGQDGVRGNRFRLSNSLVTTLSAFESAFGKRVVFFEADSYETQPPRGGLHPNLTPNYIAINADSPLSLPFVLGHEFGHAIQRQQNGLYEEFKAKVLPLFKDRAGYISKEGLSKLYAGEKLDNEVFNDTLGHFFRDPAMWNELASKDAGLTVKIGRAVVVIIDKMLRGLGARVARDVGPNVADNLSIIRSHIADLLKQYRETGSFPAFTPTPQGARNSDGLYAATIPAAGAEIPDRIPFSRASELPMSAVNVLHNDSSYLPKPGKKIKNETVASLLEEIAIRTWGRKITSNDITPEEQEFITQMGVDEFIAAYNASGKSGANWYSTAVEAAMAVAGVIHPEIVNDAEAAKLPVFAKEAQPAKAADLVMRIAMAVTSQNLTVELNSRYAEEQFNIFKTTGRFDASKVYGEKAESISGNLELANQLIEAIGFDNARKFIEREGTVRDLQTILQEILGRKVTITGNMEDVLNGAAMFGPKIGQGFLQNLMGKFTPVTIDLWMRRTWGRWSGDVVGRGADSERLARMLDAARYFGISISELKEVRVVNRYRKNGKLFRTVNAATETRLESDSEFVKTVLAAARRMNSLGQKHYKLSKQPIDLKTLADLDSGEITYNEFIRRQIRNTAKANQAFAKAKSQGNKSKKADFIQQWNSDNGLTQTHPDPGSLKPEWSRSAAVIVNALKPIEAPNPQDRRVITQIVNNIRERVIAMGYDTTNADVQAILWYPEKDLWAKLRGEDESNLKSSYDEEFIKIAESRGLGAAAQQVAQAILSGRSGAARSGIASEQRANGATGQEMAGDARSAQAPLNSEGSSPARDSAGLQAASIPAASGLRSTSLSDGQADFEAADSPANVFGTTYQPIPFSELNSWQIGALRTAEGIAGRGKVQIVQLGIENTAGGASASRFQSALFAVFRKRIAFVKGIGEAFPDDGVVSSGDPNTILIDADARQGFSFLIGHEIGHSIQHQRPDLYQRLSNEVLTMASDWSDYEAKLAKIKDYDTSEKIKAEFVNDFIGSQFGEPKFWRKLYSSDRSVFRELVDFSLKYLKSIGERIGKVNRDVRPYFKDIEAARAVLVKTLEEYQRGEMADESVLKPKMAETTDDELFSKRKDSMGLRSATIPAAAPDTFKMRIPVSKPMIDEARSQQEAFGMNVASGKLASFGTEEGRKQNDQVQAFYEFQKAVKSNADAALVARQRVAADPAFVAEKLLKAATGEDVALDAADQMAFRYLIDQRTAEAGNDEAKLGEVYSMRMGLLLQRGELARMLQIGYDRSLTPAERARAAITDAIFSPSKRVEKYAAKLHGVARKEFLDQAGKERLAAVQKELAKANLTIAAITGKRDALKLANSELMKQVLKLRDVREQGILKMVQAGADIVEIGKRYGQQAAKEAQTIVDAARTELFAKIKALAASGMSREEIRKQMEGGLNAAPLNNAAGGMSDAEIMRMIEDDFGIPKVVPLKNIPKTRTPQPKAEMSAAEIEAAETSAMEKVAKRWMEKLATSQSDTLAWGAKAQANLNAMEALIREHVKTGVVDFRQKAEALGATTQQSFVIDKEAVEERRRKEIIKTTRRTQAQEKADAAMAARNSPEAVAKRWIDKYAKSQSDTQAWGKGGKKADELSALIKQHLKTPLVDFIERATALGATAEQARVLNGEISQERSILAQIKESRKIAAQKEINPFTANWSRPEFTDGLNSYSFDTKDRAGIMSRVELIRGLAGAIGKIDSLPADQQVKAKAALLEIDQILAKYGTDAKGIFNSSKSIEDYGFDLNDINQVAYVSRVISMLDADWVDKASEVFYANLLSGLQTMAVNATAIVPAAWETTVGRGVEMAINLVMRDPMSAQIGEEKYILKALGPAITRAMSNFSAGFQAQHPMFDRDVMNQQVDWEKVLGGAGYRFGGSISGKKGDIIRIPMRLLSATDDFNRTLMACVEVGTFAYRLALVDAKNPQSANFGMKPGDAKFDKFLRVQVNTPGSMAYELAAVKASRAIFSNPLPGQNDPITGEVVPVNDLGDMVGWAAATLTKLSAKEHDNLFVKAAQAALRICFFPFQRTPFNILRQGVRYTLNPFSLFDITLGVVQNSMDTNPDGSIKWKRNAQKRNPELVSRMGKQLQGAILMTALLAMGAGEGDEDDQEKPVVITGSSPFTPRGRAEREAAIRSGIGPYRISFRRKDGSERFGFNYGRIEPLATTLAASIDLTKEVKRSLRSGSGTSTAAAEALGGLVAQAQDKSFMKGVSDLIALTTNAIAEPDVKENRKMQQFLASRVAMVMPNLIKQPIREADGLYRDRADGFMQEVMYQLAPAGQKNAKVDPYGRPAEKTGTAASRIIDVTDAGTDTVHAVDRLLLKFRDKNPGEAWFPAAITNAEFKHRVTGQNVKMSEAQLAEFRTLAGKRADALLKGQKLNMQNPTSADVDKVKAAISRARSDMKLALAGKFSR